MSTADEFMLSISGIKQTSTHKQGF